MGKVLLSGNQAFTKAALEAGCSFYAGYPITPQNDIPELMSVLMPEAGGTFIQAESEIAAINMVYGAAAAGARAMTSSSGPGISLMQECISFMAGAELPCLIVNVARGGPGLGNISASQADYLQATRGGGHGDYRTLAYAPSGVQEAWELTRLAFDRADTYRTPVVILSDGIVGQMREPIQRTPLQGSPHRPALAPKDWALTGAADRPSRVIKSLYMGEGELERHNIRLQQKYARISASETLSEYRGDDSPRLVVVAFGIAARIAMSAIETLGSKGIKGIGLFRPITLWPFPSRELALRVPEGTPALVFELNAGQMVEDVRLSLAGADVMHYGRPGGSTVTPEEVEEKILEALG